MRNARLTQVRRFCVCVGGGGACVCVCVLGGGVPGVVSLTHSRGCTAFHCSDREHGCVCVCGGGVLQLFIQADGPWFGALHHIS